MDLIVTVVEILLLASSSFFLVVALMDGRRLRRPVGEPASRVPVGTVPEPTFAPQITGHAALD